MLADDAAAAGNQGVGGLGLAGDIKPGAGIDHFHGHIGHDGLHAQEESGVARDHLGIGISADIADLYGAVRGIVGVCQFAVFDQLGQLHAGHDAGNITGLIHAGEVVDNIIKSAGGGLGSGGGQENHVGILGGGLDHIGLMGEAVGENHLAALVGKADGRVVAGLVLENPVLINDLIVGEAEGLLGLLDPLDVSIGITLVLVADEDHADLQGAVLIGGLDVCGIDGGIGGFRNQVGHGLFAGGLSGGDRFAGGVRIFGGRGSFRFAAGGKSKNHDGCKQERNKLFHSLPPFL